MKFSNQSDPARKWEKGFDGHARDQLIRLSRLPFEDKLKWLDAMHRFIRKFKSNNPDSSISSDASV